MFPGRRMTRRASSVPLAGGVRRLFFFSLFGEEAGDASDSPSDVIICSVTALAREAARRFEERVLFPCSEVFPTPVGEGAAGRGAGVNEG